DQQHRQRLGRKLLDETPVLRLLCVHLEPDEPLAHRREHPVRKDVGLHADAAVAPGRPGVDEERLALGARSRERGRIVVGEKADPAPRLPLTASTPLRAGECECEEGARGAVRRRGDEGPAPEHHWRPVSPELGPGPPVLPWRTGFIPGGIPVGNSVWSTLGMGGMRELAREKRVPTSAMTKNISTRRKTKEVR